MAFQYTYPFGYYGGKVYHLDWILPLLQHDREEYIYVEPFCGSLSVGLNRPVGKWTAWRCVANDADGRIINFFKCLRDNPERLVEVCTLTPHARSEWEAGMKSQEVDDPIESARLFYTNIKQSFSGMSGGSHWTAKKLRRDMDDTYGRLMAVANKLHRFSFENRDALYIINKRNKPTDFLYLDPPYTEQSREGMGCYKHDNFQDRHNEMIDACLKSNAMIAISGYEDDAYKSLVDAGWNVYKHSTVTRMSTAAQKECAERTECLWTNYKPKENKQMGIL